MFAKRGFLKWSVISICGLLVLTACSLRQLIISNLDWFLMREMNSYFDLTDEQYDYFRAKGNKHIEWFKETQIPWIIAEIETIRSSKTPLEPQYMTNLVDVKLRKLWITIADRLADDGAELFRKLSPKQFDHFEKALEEDSEEFVTIMDLPPKKFGGEYLDLQEDIMDKMLEWVGTLTDQQRAKIVEITAMNQEDYRKEVTILLDIKKEFIKQVKEKVKKGGVEEFLKGWARQPNIAGDDYAIYSQWKFTRQLNIWIEIEKLVTPKQREYREERLAKVIEDLRLIQRTSFK